jgi:very-short-patch-repair endonuclease
MAGRARRELAQRFADSQFGVISRDQATQCGVTRSALQHRVRPGGRWRRVLPGVYATATGKPTHDQLLMAALLYGGDGSMVTGLAALRSYKIQVPDTREIDILIPAGRHRASREFVVVRRTTRMPRRFTALGPIRYTMPARAVADAALGLVRLADVRAVVAGAVQRNCCTAADIAAELTGGPRRDSGRLRLALAEVEDGIRSAAEADLRLLIRRTRLPTPLYNARLYVGGQLVAVADAWWPDAGVAVEVDSREWHFSPDGWEHTMRRHDELTALGILLLHVTPRQIRTEPAEVVAMIRAALRAGRPPIGITTRRAAA